MTAFVAAEIAQDRQFMRVGIATFAIAKFFYVIPLFFVFTPILADSIWGPIRILAQSIPLLIVIAVITEGYFLARLKAAEWILMILSVAGFAVAVFSVQAVPIAVFTSAGFVLAGAVWFKQRQRMQLSAQTS
jgi:hypothetical protein